MDQTPSPAEPIKVLIAALGGEGGGVLASWLHAAAIAEGHFVQGTSVPGVAQRTGATTYYMEIVPGAGHRHHTGSAPVLALNAAPGEVDLVVASELLEAARALSAGFVTPDRTHLIASTARVYTVDEKAAPGDGRLDAERLTAAARSAARASTIRDFSAAARSAGCPISPVLLGAIAAAGVLPIGAAAYRSAIEKAGKAVSSNLRGFDAGYETALRSASIVAKQAPPSVASSPGVAIGGDSIASLPAAVRKTVVAGAARLADYQDDAYAQDYVGTIQRYAAMPGADPAFIDELARQLALRMSVEDVIRVAQLKLRGARLARVRAEAQAAESDIVDVIEYLKPGREEICGLLPPRLGRWLEARLPSKRAFAMTVRTTRITGHLQLAALAALRRWRPRTLRFAREAAWRDAWLSLVTRTLAVDATAAREVVALASLVRGYGGTYARGAESYQRIVAQIVEPALAGTFRRGLLGDAVLQARLAAGKDPDGAALAATLAAVKAASQPARPAAQPTAG